MDDNSPASAVKETRRRPRFKLREEVPAIFAGIPASIIDISAEGLGLSHGSPVRISSAGAVKIESKEHVEGVSLHARVRWSRLSRAGGAMSYVSGLQIEQASDAAAGLLGRLIRSLGQRDVHSLEIKRQAAQAKAEARAAQPALLSPRPASPRITSDQLLLISEARRVLANHPESAQEWYNRAKYSLAKRELIKDASQASPYRREVIVIWEYLGGRIDLDAITVALDAENLADSIRR